MEQGLGIRHYNKARYRKTDMKGGAKEEKNHEKGRKETVARRSAENRQRLREQEEEQNMVITGSEATENDEWLKRSIVGQVNLPTKVETIFRRLSSWRNISQIRDMGLYKFLVTFEKEEDKDDALQSRKQLLLEAFDYVEEWHEEEVCETRRVWIECTGLPLHGWSKENMEKIGGVWGEVIIINQYAREKESFGSFKVLVDTTYLPTINAWIRFSLKGIIYDIHTREVWCNEPLPGFPKKIAEMGSRRHAPCGSTSGSRSCNQNHGGMEDVSGETKRKREKESGDSSMNDTEHAHARESPKEQREEKREKFLLAYFVCTVTLIICIVELILPSYAVVTCLAVTLLSFFYWDGNYLR